MKPQCQAQALDALRSGRDGVAFKKPQHVHRRTTAALRVGFENNTCMTHCTCDVLEGKRELT